MPRTYKPKPPQWRACLQCGRAIFGTVRKRYCNSTCRVRALRAK